MEKRLEQGLDLCLRAGHIMLQNGAETSRIEETIVRIGRAFGADVIHSFVIPTGIFISVSADGEEKTGMMRVQYASGINLSKVHEVNDLSRRFERGLVPADEMCEELNKIDSSHYAFRLRYQHLASAISSGAFTFLFGGSWPEFLVGAICGWLSNTVAEKMGADVPRFLSVFFAALIGVIVAVLGVRLGIASNLEASILGAVIPLVPGVAITNSVRDLMAGELLSGVARASEATLTAFAIAVAVALVLSVRMHGVGMA